MYWKMALAAILALSLQSVVASERTGTRITIVDPIHVDGTQVESVEHAMQLVRKASPDYAVVCGAYVATDERVVAVLQALAKEGVWEVHMVEKNSCHSLQL